MRKMSAPRRNWLAWSFVGAVVVLGAGLLLNRVLDLQVAFFFPGSLIVNRLIPFSAYPTSVKLVMVALNVVIWAAIIYALLAIGAWRPTKRKVAQTRL